MGAGSKDDGHYFGVPHALVQFPLRKLSPKAKLLYVILCKHCNHYADSEGWFFHGLVDLARDAGLTYRSTLRAKKELLEKNVIERKRGHYTTSGWRGSDYYRLSGFEKRQSAI